MANKITLYHGSTQVIEKPIYGFGSPDNDYGCGFYTTHIREKADSWAITMGEGNHGITNEYQIDLNGLNVVNLDKYGTLAWVATILSHRGVKDEYQQLKAQLLVEKYAIDLSDADIVVGYRADDSYMDIVEWFLEDKISLADVERLFQKGELGTQYFIQSRKAFNAIKFIKSYEIEYSENLLQDEKRARKEVSTFFNNRSRALIIDKLQIVGITSTFAIDYDLVYDKNTGYYTNTEKNKENYNE